MAIVRDFGFTLPALQETRLITCSVGFTTSTVGSTGGSYSPNSTNDLIVSTGGLTANIGALGGTSTVNGIAYGRIIDRLAAPLGAIYEGAQVFAYLTATVGSTEPDRMIQLGVKLQHGASSGGGDMADYSTAQQPSLRTYFSTGRTTDMLQWEVGGRSTGTLNATSNPGFYDITAAKRFLRAVVFAGKDLVTTGSSGDENARVGATLTFVSGDILSDANRIQLGQPQFGGQGFLYALEKNSPESSSTSTV